MSIIKDLVIWFFNLGPLLAAWRWLAYQVVLLRLLWLLVQIGLLYAARRHAPNMNAQENIVIGAVAAALAGVVVYAPPFLLRASDRRAKRGLKRFAWIIEDRLCAGTTFTSSMELEAADINSLCREFEHEIDRQPRCICLFSLNLIYLWADQSKQELEGTFTRHQQPVFRAIVENAPKLRAKLEECPGEVCFVLPNPRVPGILDGFLEQRAEAVGISADTMKKFVRTAIRQARRLKRRRLKRRLPTKVLLTPWPLRGRLFATEERTLFQPYDTNGLAAQVWTCGRAGRVDDTALVFRATDGYAKLLEI